MGVKWLAFQDESLTQPNYCVPLATIGESCNVGENCESGLCDFTDESFSAMMCVECVSDLDCTTSNVGPRCDRGSFGPPSICSPKLSHGDACYMGDECESGICDYFDSGGFCG